MIHRRKALRDLFLVPMGCSLSLGMLSLSGCTPETTAPITPATRSKDESQKNGELLPGIPVKEGTKRR